MPPLHVSAGHENETAEDREWRRALAALEAGEPVVRCEQPRLVEAAATAVQGDIGFAGWAVSKAGIDSVTVEVETHGAFAADVGRRRPDVHMAFYPARSSRRPGFELTIATAGWLPGTYEVTVSARDANGSSSSVSGRIEWLPDHDQLAGELASDAPALWVGEPRYDSIDPLGGAVSVRGWVSARAGVDRVVVGLEGIEPARAFVDTPVFERDAAVPRAAFALVLDAAELAPGPRALTVEAVARDGATSRRSGEVLIDPGARYRRRLAKRDAREGSTKPVSSKAGAELRLCVTEAAPRATLRDSLDAQIQTPALITNVEQGLDGALGSLLDSDQAAAVFVDGRDALLPRALASLAARFEAPSPPDIVYSDHNALDSQGRASDPFRKPGWSPELLLSLPYVGSFVAVGRNAAEAALQLGGGRLGSVQALLLALVDEPLRVERIPEALWTRQPRAWSEVSEKEDPALRELARRRGARLSVGRRDPDIGVREVTWELDGHPAVSVVIPTAGAEVPLAACLRALRERTAYPDLEVVLVDSGGAAREAAARALDGVEHRVIPYDADGQFNFSRACNIGAEAARGEYLVFLNDDTEALGEEWLERMVAQAQLPATGVVGAKLLYPGGLVQHTGLVIDRLPKPPGVDFVAAQFAFHQGMSSGPHNLLDVPRDCSAVTGACLMVPAEILSELGGWDEGFRIDFGDVDLCLRAREAGRRVVVEPRAKLLHHEHATQGKAPHDEDDTRRFMSRWAVPYAEGDPWYHPACAFGRDWELR